MLHQIKYILIFATLLVINFSGCDEIDEPYGNEVEIDEPTELTRKAVIFEFTGIHCTNCPSGHQVMHEIDSAYHGHVIPISVHAGYFAAPIYDEDPDFRTAFGSQLYEELGQPSTPAVNVCSMNADNVIVGATSSWQGEVGQYIPDYSKFIIDATHEINDTTLTATYEITEREEVTNSVKLYAFILQDSIAGPQAGTETEPYYHRHVLRECISAPDGNEIVFAEGISQPEFQVSINAAWEIAHLYVVGIIVDEITREVYTGDMQKLIEQ